VYYDIYCNQVVHQVVCTTLKRPSDMIFGGSPVYMIYYHTLW